MKNSISKTLLQLDKKKLVKLLEKEGIEATAGQPKSELVKLLLLARRANAPTKRRGNHFELNEKKRGWLISSLVILVACSILVLLVFNPVFRSNVQYIFNLAFNSERPASATEGPVIYEKNGKTYVVYDYPLIKVKTLTDINCKRPECNLESFHNQIKTSITNLVSFEAIDHTSRQGKNLASEYGINLLPAFIFDTTIEKTENFENSKKFLTKIKDKYILQVTPFKALKGPNKASGQTVHAVTENTLINIVEYNSFSCKQCTDVPLAMQKLMDTYGDQISHTIKYLNTGVNDLEAAIAAECAGNEGKFHEFYKALYARQADWIDASKPQLANIFATMGVGLGIPRQVFNACFNDDDNIKQLVNSHFIESATLGVTGAPTFFINDNILSGVYPDLEFLKIIEDIALTENINLIEKTNAE